MTYHLCYENVDGSFENVVFENVKELSHLSFLIEGAERTTLQSAWTMYIEKALKKNGLWIQALYEKGSSRPFRSIGISLISDIQKKLEEKRENGRKINEEIQRRKEEEKKWLLWISEKVKDVPDGSNIT